MKMTTSLKFMGPCWSCGVDPQASSGVPLMSEDGKCAICNGSGFTSTNEGDEILRFMLAMGVVFKKDPELS